MSGTNADISTGLVLPGTVVPPAEVVARSGKALSLLAIWGSVEAGIKYELEGWPSPLGRPGKIRCLFWDGWMKLPS